MSAFRVEEPTIRDLAWEGKGTITYFITGLTRYGGAHKIELEVRRREEGGYGDRPKVVTWKYDFGGLGYSCEAERGYTFAQGMANYAEALADVSAKIKQFVGMEDKFEAIFQEGEVHRAEEEAKRREEARIAKEADKPVGEKLAKKIIETMKREVKSMARWDTQEIRAYERGTRKEIKIKVEFSRRGMGLFSRDWSRISKKDAIALLADSHLGSLDVSGCPALPDPNVAAFLMSKM